jgi:hypothetical protein
MSQSNKITIQETEKLRELLRTVKNLNEVSEESIKAGGTKIEDNMLDRAKRAVDSYTKYLSSTYGEPPQSYITNLETSDAAKAAAAKKEEPAPAEVELLSDESPINVKGDSK